MSRKPFILMSKQGQSKRIRREMAHTHANINAGANNSKQEILFSHKETIWPNNENEFKNNPDSCSFHSHSSPVQQPCSSNENVSVYPNIIDESLLSDIENETHETPVDANIRLNLDSDDEVIIRKRKVKKVYLSEDSDSPDDYPIVKMRKTQPSAAYPIPPKHLITGTKKNTEKFTEVSATNSTVNINQNNTENLTPGRFQSKSHTNLKNAASPDYTLTTNTLFTEEVEDVIKVSHITNSTNTGSNASVNCPSGCILSKQFAIQQSHLIQVVTDLSVQMNEVNRKLDLLLARSSLHPINPDDTFTVPDFLTNLPVKDDTSFCNLNEELKINHNKQYITKFLAGIGGRNARSLTTNILRRILLDEVAELYSLTGKQMKNSNKKSFLRTEICKIIFQICKEIYDDVTEEHLKEIISDWLNQAKVRIRRRADRQNKASGSEASEYNPGSNE